MNFDPKKQPIISMKKEEIEQFWDDEILISEEGVVEEFHFDDVTNSYSGKLKSLLDGRIYSIDARGIIKTKLVLQKGDKVLFAPIEDPDGNDFARILRIIDIDQPV